MKIGTDVLAVLSTMEIDGSVARISSEHGQLDRKLYERTNAVLVELGGKWTRGKRGHVFAEDPTERIDAAIVAGEITTAKETGFFPTPIALAKRLVEMADVRSGMRVLEPSAGTGRIVMALLRANPKVIACVEYDVDRAVSLNSLAVPGVVIVRSGDFLEVTPSEFSGGGFDRIVMNPPFARRQDIAHVSHAFSFLRPGGRLVAVMSAGVLFREDHKTCAFRESVRLNGGTIVALPDGSFKESETNVSTAVVVLNRPVTVEHVIAFAR